jgi:hypothetical protein
MMRAAPCVPILAMTLVLAASAAASAQGPASPPVLAPVEPIRFDRPESWALKYFASATLMAGLETPHTRRPGAVSIGMEFGWLPRLSSAQQQVGFNGMDTLDLNSAPLLARPRVTVGLPGRFSVVLSATPPVRFFGVTPLLVALAVERPIVETAAWTIGVRGYGQMGHVNAAFTCPQDVVQFAPGSPGNAGGCHAASSDAATLRFAGAEVGAAYRASSDTTARWLSPHAAVSVNYFDLGFQVDARVFDIIDHTRLLAHGATIAASAGISRRISGRLEASVDVFYSPLLITRSTGTRNDGLFNVRALVSYRLR